MNKTIKQISIESQLVIERLLNTEEGDVVTYDELSTVIGRDIRLNRYCLHTAINKLLREHQIYFSAVRGVGVKRCNDPEKVDAGTSFVPRIRRMAKKGVRITLSVRDYAKMEKEMQTQHNAQVSLLGAIGAISAAPKLKAIAAKVQEAQEKLPLAKTLEALK